MSRIKTSLKTEERVLSLLEEDVVLGFKIYRLRLMMSHRGISPEQVSRVMVCSVAKVRSALAARMHHTSLVRLEKTLDEVEDAVTTITDERGGIPDGCCGRDAYEAQVEMLQYDPIVREVFSRVE